MILGGNQCNVAGRIGFADGLNRIQGCRTIADD